MTRHRRGVAVVIAVVALTSCTRERDIGGNPIDGSHRVKLFAVVDANQKILWKLTAPEPGVQALEHLDYGDVPVGFKQEMPAGGEKPRPMVPGEKVVVVIVSPEFVYRGECKVEGPADFGSSEWESSAPDSAVIERALRGERIGRPS